LDEKTPLKESKESCCECYKEEYSQDIRTRKELTEKQTEKLLRKETNSLKWEIGKIGRILSQIKWRELFYNKGDISKIKPNNQEYQQTQ